MKFSLYESERCFWCACFSERAEIVSCAMKSERSVFISGVKKTYVAPYEENLKKMCFIIIKMISYFFLEFNDMDGKIEAFF